MLFAAATMFVACEPEKPITPPVIGPGSRTNPYNVESARTNQSGFAYVKGYIVGHIVTGDENKNEFTAPFTSPIDTATNQPKGVNTNLLLATSADETDINKCLTVQLPAGEVRNALNLAQNASMHKQEVLLYGQLMAYFSAPGLKETSYAKHGDNEYGTDPENIATISNPIFNQDLSSQASFDTFSQFSVKGDQTWEFESGYGGYANISAYDGASHENEDWLITPVINLEGKAGKILFNHKIGPASQVTTGVAEGWYSVRVSNNYTDGDPTAATWVTLTGIQFPTAGWAETQSGLLTIPAENCTANTRVAFRYESSNEKSATWQITDVLVGE